VRRETERQVRLMTNSRKAQSEKLATGGGRETTAVKPDNKLGPRPREGVLNNLVQTGNHTT